LHGNPKIKEWWKCGKSERKPDTVYEYQSGFYSGDRTGGKMKNLSQITQITQIKKE
jgi:hypothetical protein